MRPWSKMLRRDVDATAIDGAWAQIRSRRRRPRRALRRAMIALPMALLAVLLVVVLQGRLASAPGPVGQVRPPPPAPSAPSAIALTLAGGAPLPAEWVPEAGETVTFDEGSRLELAAGTKLSAIENVSARVELSLRGGRATFDVKPGGPRAWIIDGADVVVRVIGTRFTVSRLEERVEVAVERGKVRVESPRIDGGSRVLVAGESIVVETKVSPSADAPEGGAAGPARSEWPRIPRPSRLDPHPDAAAPPIETPHAPPDAMTSADSARREGRPRDAARLLEALVEAHDARGPLAAFTLGKVHAEDLGDHAKAGLWFERAVALGLPSGLDEEAHARAVESYARAGQQDLARRAAARYETTYPGGRHKERVRGWARD